MDKGQQDLPSSWFTHYAQTESEQSSRRAKMFYHTHPSKDEPSLSSADDYQFYFDLAFAFGIKHFYTIMENRLDHFEITVKKSKKKITSRWTKTRFSTT